jgi:RNA recognition motif-containing protein
MSTKLFVGSLSYSVSDDQLQEAFAAAGKVVSAKVIIDRDTGRSKGFGFVEMSTDEEAKKAIELVNGKEIEGRPVAVSEARPREDRPRGGGGYGGDRGDRGGYGGGNRY